MYQSEQNPRPLDPAIPRQISDGFKEARDASGFHSHLNPEERPTFHEIRALGADLYIDMGWS